MKTLLRVLVAIPVLLVTLWWALALYFSGPGSTALQVVLAASFALGTVALLIGLRPFPLALGVWVMALAIILFWWSTLRPSNDRDWQADVVRLPSAEVQGNKLIVHNLRNADYRTETDYTVRYEDRTYDLSKLRGLDLFMIYWGSPMIAHTILSWQFDGSLSPSPSRRARRTASSTRPSGASSSSTRSSTWWPTSATSSAFAPTTGTRGRARRYTSTGSRPPYRRSAPSSSNTCGA